jgi:hypothetical protein
MNNDYSINENNYKILEPIEGMPVAVKYNDNSWYRGKIIKIIPKTLCAQVLFVDYGNVESISLLLIRYLKREYFIDDVTVGFFYLK